MTINIGLVTNEALILGCDSIASVTAPMVNPFNHVAKDDDGNTLRDQDGNPLFKFKIDSIQHVVTSVISGVTKMFRLYEHGDTVVAATTTGMAVLNDRPIASLAREFCEQTKSRAKPFVNVKTVANAFLKFIRKQYEHDQNEGGLPEEHWGELEFLVGGHGKHDAFPSLFRIKIKDNSVTAEFVGGETGIAWAGQADSVERLIRGYDGNLPSEIINNFNERINKYKSDTAEALERILNAVVERHGIEFPDDIDLSLPDAQDINFPWEKYALQISYANLPLQDAVDFASFLVLTQSGRYKFSRGLATVGGRIHIGVLRKGDGCRLLNEPELSHKHTGFADVF